MKPFVLYGGALILILVILFGSKVLTREVDDKVKAFNQSLQEETNGKYDKAVETLLLMYKENSKDYLYNLRLGWLEYNRGKYEESKKYYSEALALTNNGSIEAKFGLTLPLAALQDWDKVKEIYLEILSIDPNNYTTNLRLGQIFLNRGDYSNADKYLGIIYKLNPGDYETNLSYGWTNYYLNKFDKAKNMFNNVLMLSPNDSLGLKGLDLVE